MGNLSYASQKQNGNINPIQDGSVWGCSWMGGKKDPLPKICHTYPTMMKLGSVTKKIEKLYESCDTPVEFCWHQHFIFATTNRIKGIWVCVHKYNLIQVTCNNGWKESVFGVILVHISPHLDQSNSEYGQFLCSIGE